MLARWLWHQLLTGWDVLTRDPIITDWGVVEHWVMTWKLVIDEINRGGLSTWLWNGGVREIHDALSKKLEDPILKDGSWLPWVTT